MFSKNKVIFKKIFSLTGVASLAVFIFIASLNEASIFFWESFKLPYNIQDSFLFEWVIGSLAIIPSIIIQIVTLPLALLMIVLFFDDTTTRNIVSVVTHSIGIGFIWWYVTWHIIISRQDQKKSPQVS